MITIFMIWWSDPMDGNLTLIDAWDNDSIAENGDGWEAAIIKAEEAHGARHIRIAHTEVDLDVIRKSFEPVKS